MIEERRDWKHEKKQPHIQVYRGEAQDNNTRPQKRFNIPMKEIVLKD